MTLEYDVIIIGGGPAGAVAARELARGSGLSVFLLDKAGFPRLKPCAGGISPKAEKVLRTLGLWELVESRVYRIRSALIGTPGGKEIVLSGEEAASVMHRADFDTFLLAEASAAGAVVQEGTRVDSLVFQNGRAAGVRAGDKEFRASWVIVANGAASVYRTKDPRMEHITSCTAWYRGVPFHPGRLEMYFADNLLPHYGWLFPESEDTCNIGLCVRTANIRGRSVIDVFRDFQNRFFRDRMNNAEFLAEPKVHPIFPSPGITEGAFPGTLLVGDAGRLINGFTGEGISYAMESGMLASRALIRGHREGWDLAVTGAFYRKSVKKVMAGPLRRGRMMCTFGPVLQRAAGSVLSIPPVSRLVTRVLSKG